MNDSPTSPPATLLYRTLPWALALLSGILLGICAPPFHASETGLIPWLALGPLCWALWILPRPESLRAWSRRAFLLGWLTGTVSFLISLYWITTVTGLGWVLLSLVVGLYPALWALFVALVLRPMGEGGDSAKAWLGSARNFLVALLAAAAWVALEWLRGTLFSGFGWNALGIGLRDSIPLIQIAAITGTAGLSFLCVLGAATLAITIERLRREIVKGRTKPHFDFMLAVMLVVMSFSYGIGKIRSAASSAATLATTPLKVAGVQGNVPVYHYWDSKYDAEIMEGYIRQSRMALATHPDLIVWPEASTPRPLLLDEIIYNQVKAVAIDTPADFLIGSVHYEQTPLGDYNSAILLTEHANKAQIYNKVHLVPFGEYVPFRHSFPLFSWIVGKQVPYDFDSGKGPAVMELSTKVDNQPLKIGTLICFEDTLGDLTRRFAGLGAQLLITITNDGWFEHSVATRQHLANAQLRTVETGLPLLRVADTGVTCWIDALGRVRQVLHDQDGKTFIEGVLSATIPVPLNPTPTFYTLHGDLFSHVCLGLTLALSALTFLRLRRKR